MFAGSGVYRFCKYRVGFNEGLISRLRSLRHGVEVAADTIHPEWRQLLDIIGQISQPQYPGHPHEWVIVDAHPAQPLKSTYSHLGTELVYRFIDECVIDQAVFDAHDPRRMPHINSKVCPVCEQR